MVAGSSYAPSHRAGAVLGLFLFLTGISDAVAKRGDLDPSFGTGGRVFVDVPPQYESATTIAQAADGKLLIGRWVWYNFVDKDAFSILRLNADGTLDQSFGKGGRTFFDVTGDLKGVTRAVLELTDGSIVVAGEVTNSGGVPQRFGLARFTASGVVDNSFGTRGVVTVTPDGMVGSFEAVVEQTDGRLVAAGYGSLANASSDMVVARFNVDGSLDPTFGTNGVRRIDFFGASTGDSAWDLILEPDGRLVVAGRARDPSGARKLALARLMPDGSLDGTFGTGGLVELDVAGLAPTKIALERQVDGKLVVSGQARTDATEECRAVIARFDSDGSPDRSFNGVGIVHFPLARCASAGVSSIVLDPDGAIIVASTSWPASPPSDAKVLRLTSSGEVDDTFGVNGIVTIDMGSPSWSSNVDAEIGVTMVRQRDGRIALTASDQGDWDEGGSFFMVARLLESGASAGVVGFPRGFISVPEAAGNASVVVRRTGGAAGTVNVEFETELPSSSSGAGQAGFTAVRGTLTWLDGDASDQTILIPISDDALSERSESLSLRLFNPTGGTFLTASTMRVAIQDDDMPPTTSTPRIPSGIAGRGGGGVDWLLLFALMLAVTGRLIARTWRAR